MTGEHEGRDEQEQGGGVLDGPVLDGKAIAERVVETKERKDGHCQKGSDRKSEHHDVRLPQVCT